MENEFGAELRRRRLAAGWSQAELASRVHFAKPNISKAETGDRAPSPEFARACDVALDAGGVLMALAVKGPCPYPGLAAFDQDDARWFHGRRAAMAALLATLSRKSDNRTGPLLVVGPSGAGKSSLLRAGLLPALARGDLTGGPPTRALVFTPTAEPAQRLAEARAADADPLLGAPALWVVDQLEELFTLCPAQDQRREFLDALCAEAGAAGTRLVVLGVRADFYGHCLEHGGLLASARTGHLPLGPLTREELLDAVREPARSAGLDLEPGLVDLLLHDAGLQIGQTGAGTDGAAHQDPGVLPLVAHTLRALWQQRTGRELTRAGYRAVGGIRGSVGATAEGAWTGLDEPSQPLARQLLLHLVHIADGIEPTRCRRSRADLLALVPDQGAAMRVLDAFSRARLITLDETEAYLTHEAIVRAWPRLADWIRQDRSGLLVKQRLELDAHAWEEHGRDVAGLYRESRLALAGEWAQRDGGRLGLSRLGTEFLAASQLREQTEKHAARRTARRLRRLVAGQALLLVLLLIAGGGAVLAWLASNAANDRVTASVMMARFEATATTSEDPGKGLQLAASAYHLDPGNKQAAWALRAATGSPFAGLVATGQVDQTALAVDPESDVVVTSGLDGRVTVLDLRTHRRLAAFGPGTYGAPVLTLDPAHAAEAFRGTAQGAPGPVAFAPRDHLLAVSTGTRIDEWDLTRPAAPRWIRAITAHAALANALAFSPDGAALAAAAGDSGGGTLTQWDPGSGAILAPGVLPLSAPALGVAYSPDGKYVASGGRDRVLRVWPRDGSATPIQASQMPQTQAIIHVVFSPDSKTLVSTSDDGTGVLWDVPTLQVRGTAHAEDAIFDAAFSRDGTLLATASYDRSVQLWDPGTGRQIERLTGNTGRVMGVGFGRDGSTLAGVGFDGEVAFWDLAASQHLTMPWSPIDGMALTSDGTLLATGDQRGVLRLWQRRPGARDGRDLRLLWQHPLSPPAGVGAWSMRFSPDDRTLAVATDSARVWLLDVAGRRLSPLAAPDDGDGTWTRSTAFAGPGTVLSTTHHGRTRVWDIRTGRLVDDIADLRSRALAADLRGRFFARPAAESVALYDPVSGTELGRAPLPGSTGIGLVMALTADGRLLAAELTDAAGDRSVGLWRIDPAPDHRFRLTTLPALPLPKVPLYALTFAPDGRTLASVDSGGAIQLWDAGNWQRATIPNGSPGQGGDIVFSPDSATLIGSGEDGVLRFWDLDAADALRRACQAASPVDPGSWRSQFPSQGGAYCRRE